MQEKVIIITGGGTGIGKSIALKFLKLGYKVFICGRRELVLKETALNYDNAFPFVCDVRDIEAIKKFEVFVRKKVERVDILINNAGVFYKGGIFDINQMAVNEIIQTNIKGPIWVTKTFLPLIMKSKCGRIINISSAAASTTIGDQYMLIYSMSKAALIKFTKELARELASYGICVNSISPGVIETDMGRDPSTTLEDRILELKKFGNLHPISRCGKPEEVAELVNFISSQDASWITGIDIRINGGLGVK